MTTKYHSRIVNTQAAAELLANNLNDDTIHALEATYNKNPEHLDIAIDSLLTILLMDFAAFDGMMLGDELDTLDARDICIDNPHAAELFANTVRNRVIDRLMLF